ncbi:hypothetical protein ACIQYL_20340 [Lysinibacillus xylanilyticus]|uniref:hypothetical protein n=1 Tax=Lysinibacillus xylanilyticus TaxID=582475 RepID=UPI00382DE6C2
MKRILFVTSVALLLTACGSKEDINNISEKEIEKIVDEVEINEPIEEEAQNSNQGELVIDSTTEQLGSDTLSDIALHSDYTHIAVKDDFTYILTFYPYKEPNVESKTLYVSILKNDKFVVKEKLINLASIIGDEYRIREEGFGFKENSLILIAEDDFMNNDANQKLISITVDEKGEIESKIISESKVSNVKIIQGLNNGFYFLECKSSSCSIIDAEGKIPFTFEVTNAMPEFEVLFLDEEASRLYIETWGYIKAKRNEEALAIDLVANDMIWEENGAMKPYYFEKNTTTKYARAKDGFYTVRLNVYGKSGYELEVKYYKVKNNEIMLEAETIIPLSLELISYENFYISSNNDSLNIYTGVLYKGRPTVQKYVIKN